MGACGSDLLSKFGPEIAKLISIEKAKQFLDDKVKENKDQIFSQIGEIKNDMFKSVDDQEGQMKQKLNSAAEDINKRSNGGLDKAAALQRKSVPELIGGNEIDQQFKELREELEQSFQSQQEQVNDQMDEFVKKQKESLDEQKPNIPLFSQLPAPQQEKVMKEGEKKFKKEIEAEEAKVQDSIEKNLNPEKYTEMFKKLNPTSQLDSISQKLDSLIASAESMSAGRSLFC